jgi:hypothetical protein
MKKTIIIAVAAFVVALGGATGAVVVRARKLAVAAAVAAAAARQDSLAKGLIKEPVQPAEEPAKGALEPPVVTVEVAPRDSTGPVPGKASKAEAKSEAKPAEPGSGDSKGAPAATEGALASGKPAVPARAIAELIKPAGKPVPSPVDLVGGRLSKIFSSMPPKDAAKVLEQMDNGDIVTILGSVTDKKAAEILSLLPTARSAEISRSVMKNRLAAAK